jgi:RecG-like helicase
MWSGWKKVSILLSLMVADPVNFGWIVPVYPLTEGLHQKGMRRVMRQVVDTFLPNVEDCITCIAAQSQTHGFYAVAGVFGAGAPATTRCAAI